MNLPGRMPLTAQTRADAVIAYRPQGPVTLAQFLAEAHQLADMLPPGGHILNICQDRYRFMLGFAAGMLADKVSLMPSSHTPETLLQLKAFAPDVFCLHDGNGAGIGLPELSCAGIACTPDKGLSVPEIASDSVVATLFTSGSTGTPVAHDKRWGALCRNAHAETQRLDLAGKNVAIVGTVPAQHSYGFESTVLLSLHGGCAAWSGRPFYPADIAAALAAVPRPRLLVTTPFHLRALLDAEISLPELDMLLSATAPLSEELARRAEERLSAPLFEIYGCTEAGQLASRRTTASPYWQPLQDIQLECDGDGCSAWGGHVEGRVALSDILELRGEAGFLLHGRGADMINIAGKRTSLAYLNHQLNSLPQVRDGCFFMPETAHSDGITRLAAFVVAPGSTQQQVLDALRQRIDPVFFPRPLCFVETLPRNPAGKLPRGALEALLDDCRQDARARESRT
jgi:acyl-coenzyme A synthetase/AMP-(fatty) acid ligase